MDTAAQFNSNTYTLNPASQRQESSTQSKKCCTRKVAAAIRSKCCECLTRPRLVTAAVCAALVAGFILLENTQSLETEHDYTPLHDINPNDLECNQTTFDQLIAQMPRPENSGQHSIVEVSIIHILKACKAALFPFPNGTKGFVCGSPDESGTRSRWGSNFNCPPTLNEQEIKWLVKNAFASTTTNTYPRDTACHHILDLINAGIIATDTNRSVLSICKQAIEDLMSEGQLVTPPDANNIVSRTFRMCQG